MGIVSVFFTVVGFGWGLTLGIAAGYVMFIYFEPDDVKDPVIRPLLEHDAKSLEELLPEIPPWIKHPDQEKIDWLNKFMNEMWPFLNKGVCKIIRETAEPYISESKKKYKLQSVEFETLTLGTLPPVFTGVKVLETQEKEMIFEASVKFAGNPNIKVAVKAYGLKAVAQLVDVQVFAAARITMKPLVPTFPCFSKICVSLLEKPYVDFGLKVFNLDVMAIPGLYRVVQEQIKNQVAGMYLWPKTLEIDVLEESRTMARKPMGMLYVTVLRAKNLLNKDILGKSDPYVRCLLGEGSYKTKTIMNNLSPEWNEAFNLVVMDPQSETLDITVYDWDQVGTHDKLGVQVIPLKQLTPEEPEQVTLNLLKNMDPNDSANKKNRGQLTLEVNYKPFRDDHSELNESEELDDGESPESPGVATQAQPAAPREGGGLLVVIVHQAEDLEGRYHTNPYVKLIFRGEEKKSKSIKKNRDPRWEAEFKYMLDQPPINDRLLVEIKSKSKNFMHSKESLGHVEIDLADVVRNKRINEKYHLMDSKTGRVQVELQWKSTMASLSQKAPSTIIR